MIKDFRGGGSCDDTPQNHLHLTNNFPLSICLCRNPELIRRDSLIRILKNIKQFGGRGVFKSLFISGDISSVGYKL